MGKEKKRTRINSKVDQLPDEIRASVDYMLSDTSNSYDNISIWLKTKGYEISKSSVGRYALRTNKVTQRLLDAQKQTEALLNVARKNPEADYTDAGMRILMNGLITKLATAEEEFDDMDLDKAGRLITSISRTQVYKDKVKQDMKKKVELAFKGLEEELMIAINSDPTLAKELKSVLERAKEKMISDE